MKGSEVCAFSFLLFVFMQGVNSLRDVRLVVNPPVVLRGGSVDLLCQRDMEGAPLYTVKWYRGTHEFYRYTPSESPETRVFMVVGLNVDMNNSNGSVVRLKRMDFQLAGEFSCEVTADIHFSTLVSRRVIEVVDTLNTRVSTGGVGGDGTVSGNGNVGSGGGVDADSTVSDNGSVGGGVGVVGDGSVGVGEGIGADGTVSINGSVGGGVDVVGNGIIGGNGSAGGGGGIGGDGTVSGNGSVGGGNEAVGGGGGSFGHVGFGKNVTGETGENVGDGGVSSADQAPPRKDPVLMANKERFQPGDPLQANCTSGPARPAVNLTIYINDEPFPSSKSSLVAADFGLYTSQVVVDLTLTPEAFVSGRLRVACVASTYYGYRSSAIADFFTADADPKPERITLNGSTKLSSSLLFIVLCTFLAIRLKSKQ